MTQWKQKRKTMRHYDQLATVYDTQYFEEQEAKIKTALNGLHLQKEHLLLDAGCGTGLLFPHVAHKVKLLIGVDVSSIILKEAKKRVKKHGNTALIRADVGFLSFQNNIFDVVFAVTLLQNTPKPYQILKEMKRVTKQNATIVATGLKKSFSQKEFRQLLRRAGLKIKVLRLDAHLKEYIATCIKLQRKP